MERYLRERLGSKGFSDVSHTRSKMMAAVRGKGNRSTELKLRMAMVRSSISGWELHPSDIPGRPDFYFRDARLAIFVDGCFWHGCHRCGHTPKTRSEFWRAKFERTRDRDKKTRRLLRRSNTSVLVFWEHELMANPDLSVKRVLAKLSKR